MKFSFAIGFLVLASWSAQAQPQADFPKIDPASQKARDFERGYILEQERQAEVAALAAAEKRFATAGASERTYLENDVERHRKNLKALDAEISRLAGSPTKPIGEAPIRVKAASAARPVIQAPDKEVPFWDVYRRDKAK